MELFKHSSSFFTDAYKFPKGEKNRQALPINNIKFVLNIFRIKYTLVVYPNKVLQTLHRKWKVSVILLASLRKKYIPDIVFTEEILNGKFHFLCSVSRQHDTADC